MKEMHIFKEEKFFPASSTIKIAKYAIAHCGVKFSQFQDDHVVEQDVEVRVRGGLPAQRFIGPGSVYTAQVCEDCLASASMQMLILKWTDI